MLISKYVCIHTDFEFSGSVRAETVEIEIQDDISL